VEQYVKYLRKSRFDRDYADLSTEETLKRHDAILSRLAAERGYRVVKTYCEVVSGESIAARPEVQKLLEEVAAGTYAGVLVVDLERLARGSGADQAYISQVFQFSGTKIITPLKVYDPNNEFDEEYFEFGLFMSRREYKTINRRLVRGRDSSAAEGKYLGSVPPYGYRRAKLRGEKGYTLAPEPAEAAVLQRIFALYCRGEGTKAIANRLNDEKVPTRHGRPWTYGTVANLLSNPVYTGKIRRGWSKQVRSLVDGKVKKSVRRQKDPARYAVYSGLHPALIDENLFERAQELRRKKAPAPKVKERLALQNPFVGLIYCAVCGGRIERTTASRKRGGGARLRCVNSRSCHNASADLQAVEQAVLEALRSWLEGYRVRVDAAGFSGEIAEGKAAAARLAAEQAQLEQQLDAAFGLVERGVYTLDVFQARREKLEAAIRDGKTRIAEINARTERLQSTDAARENLVPRTEALLASYAEMTAAEKNGLLRAVLYRIEYKKTGRGPAQIDLFPQLPKY
jgi:site-specific DNA recombinase